MIIVKSHILQQIPALLVYPAVALLLVLVLPFTAHAQFTYHQTLTEADVVVETDGSLSVDERRVFDISGLFSYLQFDIKHNGLTLQNLQLSMDGRVFEQLPSRPETQGASGVFYPEQTEQSYSVWLYDDIHSGEAVINISYSLSNAVVSNGDVALLEYSSAGRSGLSMQEMVSIQSLRDRKAKMRIRFRNAPADHDVHALSRTLINNIPLIPSVENGEVKLGPAASGSANIFGLRVLMNHGAVPELDASATELPGAEAFWAEHQVWVDAQAALLLERQRMGEKRSTLRPFGLLMLFLSLVTLVRIFRKPGRWKKLEKEGPALLTPLPEPLPLPTAMMLQNAVLLLYPSHIPMLMGPSIMDLSQRGYFKLSFGYEPGRTESISKVVYQFPIEISRTDKPLGSELRSWEVQLAGYIESRLQGKTKALLEIFPDRQLINKMVADDLLSQTQADSIIKKAKVQGKAFIEMFRSDLFAGTELMRYNRGPLYLNVAALLLALLMVANQSGLGILLLIISLTGLAFSIFVQHRYTDLGHKLSVQWKAYRKALIEGTATGNGNFGHHTAAASTIFFNPQVHEKVPTDLKNGLRVMMSQNQEYAWEDLQWLTLCEAGKQYPETTLEILTLSMQYICHRGVMRRMPKPIAYRRRQLRR